MDSQCIQHPAFINNYIFIGGIFDESIRCIYVISSHLWRTGQGYEGSVRRTIYASQLENKNKEQRLLQGIAHSAHTPYII
jgi:hypothetical protein